MTKKLITCGQCSRAFSLHQHYDQHLSQCNDQVLEGITAISFGPIERPPSPIPQSQRFTCARCHKPVVFNEKWKLSRHYLKAHLREDEAAAAAAAAAKDRRYDYIQC